MADLPRMLTCSVHPLPYRANPAEYFAAIEHAPGAVLLDSGRPAAERGRYDLLSAWPLAELTVAADESGGDFLQRLRHNLQQLGPAQVPAPYELPFAGGLIGYLSYDFAVIWNACRAWPGMTCICRTRALACMPGH